MSAVPINAQWDGMIFKEIINIYYCNSKIDRLKTVIETLVRKQTLKRCFIFSHYQHSASAIPGSSKTHKHRNCTFSRVLFVALPHRTHWKALNATETFVYRNACYSTIMATDKHRKMYPKYSRAYSWDAPAMYRYECRVRPRVPSLVTINRRCVRRGKRPMLLLESSEANSYRRKTDVRQAECRGLSMDGPIVRRFLFLLRCPKGRFVYRTREGGSVRQGLRLRRCNRVAVEQQLNADWSSVNAESRLESSC